MSIRARARQAIKRQDGASAVEFLLVFPLLLLLVVGIVTYGLVLAQQLALNHAVREGARAAVVVSSGSSGTVSDKVNAAFPWSGTVTVQTSVDRDGTTPTGVTACGSGLGDDLIVQASIAPSTPFSGVPGIPETLNAGTVFRCEF